MVHSYCAPHSLHDSLRFSVTKRKTESRASMYDIKINHSFCVLCENDHLYHSLHMLAAHRRITTVATQRT